MTLIIHQIKREVLALRTGLILWGGVLGIHLLYGITGFGGDFSRSASVPLLELGREYLQMLVAMMPVVMSAAVAITDPPMEEEAHWRALPARPRQLLSAKLLTIALGIVLPLLLVHILILAWNGAGEWSAHAVLGFLSNMPAWMLFGFGLGAVAGTWKRFAIGIGLVILGITSLFFIVNEWDRGGGFFWRFRFGLDSFMFNNLFLPSAAAMILLRYFTRLHPAVIAACFVGMLPVTVISGYLLLPLVPRYHPEQSIKRTDMKLSVDLPAELLLQTNLPIPKLVGFVNYSDLSVTELKPPHYFLPSHLQSRLKTVSQNGSTLTHFHSPKFRFSGEWLYSRNSGEKTEQMFMERILALPRALPEMKILNPPYEAGMGINLFEISESELVRQAGQNWNLLSTVRVKFGTYQKVAELPLRVGAEVSQSGWSPGCPKPVHDHN